ncbi:MAG: substrate-binding domain-containing protein [Marinilabilia sp.]
MIRHTTSRIFTPLIFILILVLSGCENKDKIKMGFLYSSDVTIRFNKEAEFFKERAEELGAEVIIDHARDNDAVQYEKAMEMMEEGIDLLTLIAVNVNTAENIVKEANARDIPVMAYNRLISNCDLSMFIAGDNEQLGNEMAGYAVDHKPEGNYVILNGDKFDRNAVELMASIDETLEPHIESGDINVLYRTYIENWSPDHAAYELEQLLAANPEPIDAVIACFDGMGVASIEVLEEYGYENGEVIVTGQDANIESCRKIVEGTQHITMYHPLRDIAYKAAEVAIDMVNGEDLEEEYDISYVSNDFKDVPTVKIPSIPVTKDNIDEVLIESGFYDRSEIYD